MWESVAKPIEALKSFLRCCRVRVLSRPSSRAVVDSLIRLYRDLISLTVLGVFGVRKVVGVFNSSVSWLSGGSIWVRVFKTAVGLYGRRPIAF